VWCMRRSCSAYLVSATLFASLAAAAAVSTDYDHKANFGRYHTYSWIGVKAGDTLRQERIMAAVDSNLARKGWTKVPSNGDAAVSAFGKTREEDTLQSFYDSFPGWGWYGFGESSIYTEPAKTGGLVVDVFDGKSKRLIWRGKASGTLFSSPEKRPKKLDEAVAQLFKRFPPNERD
jgi:uncharacterized protein DUF4136